MVRTRPVIASLVYVTHQVDELLGLCENGAKTGNFGCFGWFWSVFSKRQLLCPLPIEERPPFFFFSPLPIGHWPVPLAAAIGRSSCTGVWEFTPFWEFVFMLSNSPSSGSLLNSLVLGRVCVWNSPSSEGLCLKSPPPPPPPPSSSSSSSFSRHTHHTPDEVPDAGCGGLLGDDDAIGTRALSCAGSGDGACVEARQRSAKAEQPSRSADRS